MILVRSGLRVLHLHAENEREKGVILWLLLTVLGTWLQHQPQITHLGVKNDLTGLQRVLNEARTAGNTIQQSVNSQKTAKMKH